MAVSGTGPGRDSNGSGKTTFLAAVSLLLGDPEWRVATTGGNDALGLLFDPDLSGDAAGLYDPARVGYVAGVFAQVTADGHYDELTVWVRIASDESPRLAARWAPGVHLTADPQLATATWNGLGRDRQIGPHSYVEQLYGGTGRCLAYVTSRGNRDTDTSLMQLQARLSPSRIGSELIVLLGLEHLIDGERDLRAKLADAQQRLASRIDEHERREREWVSMLTEVEARDSARQAVADGRQLWRLRIARRLLDAVAEEQRFVSILDDLDVQLAEAQVERRDRLARAEDLPDLAGLEREVAVAGDASDSADARHRGALGDVARHETGLDGLIERIHALTTKALAAPSGISVDDAEAGEARASLAVDEATRSVGAAEADLRRARADLAAVTEHGEADPAARRSLEAAGVRRQRRSSTPSSSTRRPGSSGSRCSPRGVPLWSSRDRSATRPSPPRSLEPSSSSPTPTPRTRFRTACSRHRQAPPGSSRRCSAASGRPMSMPTPASSWPVGSSTSCAAAMPPSPGRGRCSPTPKSRTSRRPAGSTPHDAPHVLALDALDRLRAAAELAGLHAEESRRTEAVGRRPAGARRGRSGADRDALGARPSPGAAGDLDPGTAGGRAGGSRRRPGGSPRSRTRSAPPAQQSVASTSTAGARRGRTPTTPQSPRSMATIARRARCERRANEQLGVALERIGVDSLTGDGAPTPAIGGVVRARGGLDELVPPTYEVRRFDTVTRPLEDWLEDQLESDTSFRQEVEIERARWDELIGAARSECATQADLLDRHRDMVEQQIEAALGQVSTRYAELDAAAGGYGAQLRWRSLRPDAPTDLWTWEVTPEWRRGRGAKWLPYTRQANSAMQKQHRTHLVLAALLAAQNPAGRVLVVDEAGNDFGREHLRQVLTAFAHVADTHGVTVIAACQDKVLEEVAALGAARLLLWFERLSDASPLCRPTRVWGFDEDGRRVELTRPAVEAGRLL